jgi:ABC-type multidrug transport system fused ATPase/permease subunit
LRFYDIESGSLTFDGLELKSYDLSSLRKSIGYVSQEPTLFSGTLKENIIYGLDDEPSLDRINQALSMANARDFVYNA